MCRWGAALALALLLTSQAALAERVAVSDLEGDKKDRLRAQVTAALRKTRKVQVLPPAAWAMAAGKKGLRGPAAVEPEAVSRLAPKLKVDAVLTGSVGRDFSVRLLDERGREVWSGRFPLKNGVLPPKEAQKLALAVSVAVKADNHQVAPPPKPVQVEPPEARPAPEPPVVARSEPPPPSVIASEPVPQPRSPEPASVPVPEEPLARAPRASEAKKPALTWAELEDESHTYTTELPGSGGGYPENRGALAQEEGTSAGGRFPPRVKVWLGAAVTWRAYCARPPGVTTCTTSNVRPPEPLAGDIVGFSGDAPYAGLAAKAEVFPLLHWPSLLRGAGLTLAYQRSFARTMVTVSTPVGSTPEREVYATDTGYEAMLAYRYFFNRGMPGTPLWGYAGVRLGALGRAFEVADTVDAPLPVVHRFFPGVGLDVSVPLMSRVRIEAAGQFFLMPTPGHSLGGDVDGSQVAEVRDYGESVSSLGWAAELGIAGDIWGPFGYSARFRLEQYRDSFTGQGARRGWTNGGVAEDTYSGILAGVTAGW